MLRYWKTLLQAEETGKTHVDLVQNRVIIKVVILTSVMYADLHVAKIHEPLPPSEQREYKSKRGSFSDNFNHFLYCDGLCVW